jgi:hypothetical protein
MFHATSNERSVERSARSGRVQPVMRSLDEITGVDVMPVQEERSGRRCERNGPEGVETSTVDRQQSPENRGPARSPRLLRASARSRGVTSGEHALIHRVGGKSAPVTARGRRAVAGRQAGGGGAGPAGPSNSIIAQHAFGRRMPPVRWSRCWAATLSTCDLKTPDRSPSP